MNTAPGIRCRSTVDLRHAFDRRSGGLGAAGILFQMCGVRVRRGIGQLQPTVIAHHRKITRVGKAKRRILWRLAGHGDGAFGHLGDGAVRKVRGRHRRLALADQNPQADLDAFGPLGLFQCAMAHIDRDRCSIHRHRVGLGRTRTPRCIQKRACQAFQSVCHSAGPALYLAPDISALPPKRKGRPTFLQAAPQ